MRALLKYHPLPEGLTDYCDKSFNLVNQRMFSKKKIKNTSIKPKHRSRKRKFGQVNFPDIFRQGSPLPRPYGPRDNLRMQSMYEIHGFGNSARKARKSRNFGTRETPGTPDWKHSASIRNKVSSYMNKYANEGNLGPAKGWNSPSALYMKNSSNSTPNITGMPNEPAQFTNNQLNSPVILQFGIRKKKISKRKKRPCLIKRSSKHTCLSKKYSKKFGSFTSNAGPNKVGYEKSIPLYHAGANTIDFATNMLFRPNVGSFGKVQPDGITPRAWLTQNTESKYGFGGMVYTPNGLTYGSGHNTIMQPSFGGNTITLNNSGRIQITKPSKN